VTATPLPEVPPIREELDIAPMTVLALTWLGAIIATSLTLWLLVAVIGNS
jgi:hypothetical protein